ncbi:30S ribosomal protein S16 [Candidatus Amesbacteria bacterium RIFCSPHIGHO2_02_FULL_47_9]|uniref:Small ribosomal subunit protein bS16 n=1 Tax=Candidatus Amesbacteria bacterium RIFCSPHIGHO2_01_FULL_48_32b TaxID=1797253 RepID=A0A1F4YG40_9BACT|nr:MAG: 30S ribosomal protein S16 [Candidatus Amesbacteria bacterium RIFCSPHIGHO2_01_FULL_48_32b]OGD04243.1 MAG: 30S ribosomal protein S16 [Candidatus Amesbacteria bacterium RIFCSPHIGHO2_02_FULL_47_9]OGD07343.1 MAG: 30S ribosomal protein S16 [Candidatus Amesbacteria bacterium RIFCSPLOWO2_01_FULL_49_25]
MLKIKLSPFGKKHEPHYRIVVMEAKSKLTGAKTATIGQFHPLTHTVKVDQESLNGWLSKGAQPTPKVKRLLKI